jgi:hypothetical protein
MKIPSESRAIIFVVLALDVPKIFSHVRSQKNARKSVLATQTISVVFG